MGSVEISREALAAVALVSGLWLALALWLSIRGLRRSFAAAGASAQASRAAALLEAAPAAALIVHPDFSLEAGDQAVAMLGLGAPPASLLDLANGAGILSDGDAQVLAARVAESAATAASFAFPLRLRNSHRSLLVRGAPAPRQWRPGTVMLWFVDATEAEANRAGLEEEVGRLTDALDALSGLIEAAPFPMWYRGPDLRLAMVNSAYVDAVEAEDAAAVVSSGTELVDEGEGSAVAEAAAVRDSGELKARHVPATLRGERRMIRVVEVPLGPSGVAGYAIDVEDREQARADLARFLQAQHDMLDRLSAGVAQFSRDRQLTFFNMPFARLFSLGPDFLADHPEFDRVIDAMREQQDLPEVRDYPAWKEERRAWFTSGLAAEEEDWLLPSGKHLRVVAQPLPDGGLLLIFEDRTEQIRLASARDTLLRVRSATFDNLFEAVGVFASDGRLQLWNNRFQALWQFEEEQLAGHPRIDALVPHIAVKLMNPGHAGLLRELVRSATVERRQRRGRAALVDGRDFEFAAVPLPDGNALFTMLDVTDSRRIETALRERNDALEAADRLRTAFMSNISYELRTPLTSIAGFAEMMEAGYAGALGTTAEEYVKAILAAVARLGSLIDDVLEVTHREGAGAAAGADEIDLGGLCAEAADQLAELAEVRHVEIVLDLSPSAGFVAGDRRRLGQVLDSILRSAIGNTADNGRVAVQAAGTHWEAEITISDSGGAARAERSQVAFEWFDESAPPPEEEQDALKLGLPLARQIIEAHHGSWSGRSNPDGGATVTIRLPRSPG